MISCGNSHKRKILWPCCWSYLFHKRMSCKNQVLRVHKMQQYTYMYNIYMVWKIVSSPFKLQFQKKIANKIVAYFNLLSNLIFLNRVWGFERCPSGSPFVFKSGWRNFNSMLLWLGTWRNFICCEILPWAWRILQIYPERAKAQTSILGPWNFCWCE